MFQMSFLVDSIQVVQIFLMHLVNLYFLFDVFRPFTFNVIIDVFGFRSIILLFSAFLFFSVFNFFVSSFLFFCFWTFFYYFTSIFLSHFDKIYNLFFFLVVILSITVYIFYSLLEPPNVECRNSDTMLPKLITLVLEILVIRSENKG